MSALEQAATGKSEGSAATRATAIMPHSTALRPAADSMLYAELFYTLLLPAIRIKFKFHFCTLHVVLWSVYKVMEAGKRAAKKFSYSKEQQKIFHISESNLFFADLFQYASSSSSIFAFCT